MFGLSKPALLAALIAGIAGSASAADLYEPPVVEAPPPVVYQEANGWYLRGDIDYHWAKLRGTEYITYGCCGVVTPGTDDFDTTSLKGSFSLGTGVGYQINRYLRTDLTADYWFKSDFNGTTSGTCGGVACTSVDSSSYSAFLLLANAYADLGTWYGVTPYVGAGIGGAHIAWGDLINDDNINPAPIVHPGESSWRFAWALMAGASYCLTDNLDLDVGYRFTHINGGRMFGYAAGVGPGFDKGFNVHEARAGLRYSFGGTGRCTPEQVAYEPEPVPVYK
jgi:opacity protein-like surface antigen